jgi:hypothetical protein
VKAVELDASLHKAALQEEGSRRGQVSLRSPNTGVVNAAVLEKDRPEMDSSVVDLDGVGVGLRAHGVWGSIAETPDWREAGVVEVVLEQNPSTH